MFKFLPDLRADKKTLGMLPWASGSPSKPFRPQILKDQVPGFNIIISPLKSMISLTGISPNTFIKDYRLNRALNLFNSKKGNISEIAFETGFSSPSYFTKCFQTKFGLKPSDYLETMKM